MTKAKAKAREDSRVKPYRVRVRSIPEPSLIGAWAPGDFSDCYEMALSEADASLDAMALMVRVAGTPPAWVRLLMTLRNRVVGVFGLKNDGAIGPGSTDVQTPYRVGDRFGLFTVYGVTPDEVVIGVDDRHLDVRVSLCRTHVDGRACAAITTVVRIHNALGRAYMAVVAPAHRIIAPATLRHGLG